MTETPKRVKTFKETLDDDQNEHNIESNGVHSHSAHSHDIKPIYIKIEGLLDPEKVEYLMGIIHWETDDITLLRCKGLYYCGDRDSENISQYMLQGVDDTFE